MWTGVLHPPSCSAFHIAELWVWISSLSWLFCHVGTSHHRSFIRNLQEKNAAELHRGSIKAVHNHYTGIKADPLSFKYSMFESRLSFTQRLSFSVHTASMISSFFSRAEKKVFFPPRPVPPYHQERCRLHKQTALTWHEVRTNETRINNGVSVGRGTQNRTPCLDSLS